MKVKPETVEARNQRRLWAAIDKAIEAWENDSVCERIESVAHMDAMCDLRTVRYELKPKWIKD